MTTPTWTTCRVTLGALQPWAANPRLSTKAQAKRILASFAKFGQVLPVAIGPDNEVYDGHQRLSALLTVHGAEYEIDARRSNRPLTDEERQQLVITLHAGAVGAWDWDALAGWDAAQLQAGGLDAEYLKTLNADAAALATMLEAEKPAPVDAEPQIDRAEELRAKWGVEPGQLWRLGEHRLICGDCTDAGTVALLMQGEEAAICFTSPPYNAGVSAQLSGNTSIDDNLYKDEYDDDKMQADYLALLRGFTNAALSVCKYVFVNIQPLAGNKRALIEYWAEFVDKFADVAIWDKGRAAPEQARRVMDSRFEFVIVFSHDATRAIGTREFRGMVHNVYSGSPQKNNDFADMHAATFPVDLPAHFIGTFTNPEEVIYEPFNGTGTTILACQNLSRRCRAVEISPAYVAVALERWAQATGKTPELVDALEVENGRHK